jgi:DNA-binding SARP family transcriptional activator/Tfp pilus assembly protein PilF
MTPLDRYGGDVKFRLLGPFEIEADEPVSIPRRRERCLLAVLLLEQGRSVAAERLADLLWDGEPPSTARTTLRSHVSRLRAAVGSNAVWITRQGSGYQLRTDPTSIDAHVFRALVQEARELTEPDRRSKVLRSALDLWRGPVLADIATGLISDRLGAGLEELRLEALDQRIAADLAIGLHRELIGELRELLASQPNRERFAAHLMLALYRSGRQGDALAVYDESRRALANELGLSPGSELRRLHERILRADPVLELPEQVTVAEPGAELRTPRQLPHDIANFMGREGELAELQSLASIGRAAPTIVAIDGAPGTGKTTLAVHWAHRIALRYPDIQLYLNLRGHSPGGPVTPAAATETLLRAIGVRSELIPPSVEERSALLRSSLAGREVLMLLDDARDSDQVRPLLPGTGSSLVIITSRNQLRGLSIRDGAHRVTLQRMPQDQAVDLLAAAIGPERVAAERAAAARLVALCDHLPLALAIVAERAHRAATLAEVVAALEQARLDNLGTGEDDPHTDLRAALSWSYRALHEDAAAMFRKLGLHPASDIGLETAAALADLPAAVAKAALDQLVSAHLVEQRRPNRYELHDLIRLYATEAAHNQESAEDRETAVRRVLDWYLYAAVCADEQLSPHRRRDFLEPYQRPRMQPPALAGPLEAEHWFEQEYDCLRVVTAWAAANGWAPYTWRIALSMNTFVDRAIPWREGLEFCQSAVRAAESAGEPVGRAYALNSLGSVHSNAGEIDMAKTYFERARALFHELSHDRGEAMSMGNIGLAYGSLGLHEEARRYATMALELCAKLNYPRGTAQNLDNLGLALTVSGQYERAVECHEQAHTINREIGDAASEATNLHHLACAYAGLGDVPRATRAFRTAVSIYRNLGGRRWEATVLIDFGKMLGGAGLSALARATLESALGTMRDLGDPRAQDIQAELAKLPGQA